MLLLMLAAPVHGAVQIPPANETITLTNLSQVPSFTTKSPGRYMLPVRIKGTMLMGGAGKGIASLDESSRPHVLEWNRGVQVGRGQQFVLSGSGVVDGSNVWFTPVPLIDNDGLHSVYEQSATVWLGQGNHPIELRYFNAGGENELAVFVEGPGIERQPLPDDWLFHREFQGAPLTPVLRPGLTFECFKGQWERMPDFNGMQAFTNGVSTNFDLNVSGEDSDFGIQFDGVVHVPVDGWYVFSCISDDGSLLYLNDHENSIETVGTTNLPPLVRAAAGQLIGAGTDEFVGLVEGQVTMASTNNAGLLTLELTSGRGCALLEAPWNSGGDPQGLIGTRVQARGLCQAVFTPEEYRVAGLLRVPWAEWVRLIDVSQKLWSRQPVAVVSEVLDDPVAYGPFTLSCLRGILLARTEDGRWVFEDTTGQMEVEDASGQQMKAGTRVEVLGWCRNDQGTEPVYSGVMRAWRPTTIESKAGQLPLLDSIEKIKQMSREDAALGYPVRVRGVVTFVWPDAGFFLQDPTGSIDVRVPASTVESPPHIGEYWEVEGVTFAEFAPNIRATHAVRLGMGTLPDVVRPNWDQLVDGSLDTQYVEIQGVVSGATQHSLSLLTRGGRIEVQLPEIPAAKLAQFEGALVRVRGCVIPGRDIATQRVLLGELELRNASVALDEPAPDDLFAVPLRQAADLLLFDAHTSPIQRTRLQGVLLEQRDAVCYMMDGSNGVRVLPKISSQWRQGDRLEVVGFPDLKGPSPLLLDAVVRVTGKGQSPAPLPLTSENLIEGPLDSTLVEIDGTLLGLRRHASDQLLEMRTGSRIWVARLPLGDVAASLPPVGSELKLTGVYVGQGGDWNGRWEIDSFELLLHSPRNIVVLHKPSWLTAGRALAIAGGLAAVLALAFGWISILHRQVDQRTLALTHEIDQHKRTELKLEEQTVMLTHEIEERVRMESEIEKSHRQLLNSSRLAGMAEVATSVLHNVGNVMTNVNVLGNAIVQHVRNSRVPSVTRLGRLLKEQQHTLPDFLTADKRGRAMPDYVDQLGNQLDQEQKALLDKVKILNENIQHINEIVAMQQSYTKVSGVLEKVRPRDVLEDALRMHGESLKRHKIELVREVVDTPAITMDRHKVLQILFNLLENAKHACLQDGRPGRKIHIELELASQDHVCITVTDNGVGIAPENITRIFGQGFSTRKDGHGFGLHSSVLAAQDMGGSLTAHSDGVGCGARFVLEIQDLAQTAQSRNGQDVPESIQWQSTPT